MNKQFFWKLIMDTIEYAVSGAGLGLRRDFMDELAATYEDKEL